MAKCGLKIEKKNSVCSAKTKENITYLVRAET